MLKLIYIAIGSLSLCLGVVGIFVPGLPTTPFLLLTVYCYARGSQRFYDWFIKTKIYKKYLESFVQTRSMTLRTKLTILIPVSIMLMFPLIFVKSYIMKAVIVFLLLFKYLYFFMQIKTIPTTRGALKND